MENANRVEYYFVHGENVEIFLTHLPSNRLKMFTKNTNDAKVYNDFILSSIFCLNSAAEC